MSVVMGLDPAAGFGWAAYDLDKPPSAIESASLKLEGDILDKLFQMRQQLVPLIRRYKPVFAVVESPFKFAPRYQKQPKRDMLTGIVTEEPGEGETTINPATISHAGQIAGAATMALLAWNIMAVQAAPNEWQHAVIPKSIYAQFGKGMAKQRAHATCGLLRIVSPNTDSRDAALISVFAAGHAQFKLLQQRAQMAGAA
jgi:Holliday junction resolvasome RuvABC endonuclease subunit